MGETIEALRILQGITEASDVAEFERKAGLAKGALKKIEGGKHALENAELGPIARLLKVKKATLVRLNTDPRTVKDPAEKEDLVEAQKLTELFARLISASLTKKERAYAVHARRASSRVA